MLVLESLGKLKLTDEDMPVPADKLDARLAGVDVDVKPARSGSTPDGEGRAEQHIEQLFNDWASASDPVFSVTTTDIRHQILAWVKEKGLDHFTINRPKLLAMMRGIDADRSGYIGLAEFNDFVLQTIDERQRELSSRVTDRDH